MNLKVKNFSDLTTTELYEILKVRSEIFVVEQNCIYQDLDDKDYNSLHMFFEENNQIISYLRAFYKTPSKDTVQMGRILTRTHGQGHGRKLLEESIKLVKEKMNPKKIYIEAQKYAIGFYQKFGFKVTSDEFLEDGIPHVTMELDC